MVRRAARRNGRDIGGIIYGIKYYTIQFWKHGHRYANLDNGVGVDANNCRTNFGDGGRIGLVYICAANGMGAQ